MRYLLIAAVLLGGCTFSSGFKLNDTGISREEINRALQQRDADLVALAKQLRALELKVLPPNPVKS